MSNTAVKRPAGGGQVKRHDVRWLQALPRTRKILIAGTVLLAVIYWVQGGGSEFQTPLGTILNSLSYAFTTALIGAAFAGFNWLVQRALSRTPNFSRDWHWCWGFFLVMLLIGHMTGFTHP